MTTVHTVSNCKMLPDVQYTKINVAGAIYYSTDMIIFEEYEDTDSARYLHIITLEDDIKESRTVIAYSDLPEDLVHLYEYVKSTSSIETKEQQYVLYGNHIGRSKNYKFRIMSFPDNPFKQSDGLEIHQNMKEYILATCHSIYGNLQKCKNAC